ncbi:hypothetical protein [Nocardia asiatica]|uniref:hypothetical protein n=1 Tax=Nocardia asiatica TaxID=209252 RepID=UPI0024571D6C|nr:hypothetical protein [Nocardia asiatica]
MRHLPSVTEHTIAEGHADGRFTSRTDLAASMLAVLDDRYLRKRQHSRVCGAKDGRGDALVESQRWSAGPSSRGASVSPPRSLS